MGKSDAILEAKAPHLAEEVAVALVYNGSTQAVMMATPADLEDFARGFTLTEGIARPEDMLDLEVVRHAQGIELRMWLPAPAAERLAGRRRAMAGPVGCGLCGIDSLEAAVTPAARVATDALRLTPAEAKQAVEVLRRRQPLHDATHAAHAAGLWRAGGLHLVREDVGRHNALDKLVGGARAAGAPGAGAAVVLTSRVSVEMVQKAAAYGAEAILAVSAATSLAVDMAEAAGLTLVAGLKAGGAPRALTHPHRLEG